MSACIYINPERYEHAYVSWIVVSDIVPSSMCVYFTARPYTGATNDLTTRQSYQTNSDSQTVATISI